MTPNVRRYRSILRNSGVQILAPARESGQKLQWKAIDIYNDTPYDWRDAEGWEDRNGEVWSVQLPRSFLLGVQFRFVQDTRLGPETESHYFLVREGDNETVLYLHLQFFTWVNAQTDKEIGSYKTALKQKEEAKARALEQ
jgi:hypothetical protein